MVLGDMGSKTQFWPSVGSSRTNTRLISDSVFLSVKYGAELPVFSSKILLVFYVILD